MSDGSVHVTVDTSAVAAEVSRLEGHIDDLNDKMVDGFNIVSENINILHGDLNKIKVELLAQLVALIAKTEEVKNEVTKMMEASAQTELLRGMSEFVGQQEAFKSSSEQIIKQLGKVRARLDDISQKFDTVDSELIESYHIDIHRLGKYIFEIIENYEKTVEERILTGHTSFHETVLRSIDRIRKFRENALGSILQNASTQLQKFLTHRRTFTEKVEDKVADKMDDCEGKVEIPFLYIESEGTSPKIHLAEEIASIKGETTMYQFNNTDYFKELRGQLNSQTNKFGSSLKWRNMTEDEIKKMESNFETLQNQGYISAEYKQKLIEVLRLYPPQVADAIGDIKLTVEAPKESSDENTNIRASVPTKRVCPSCGLTQDEDAIFCAGCGKKLGGL